MDGWIRGALRFLDNSGRHGAGAPCRARSAARDRRRRRRPTASSKGSPTTIYVELYRTLILLRTYDERSVVYHRQGRIGTYAIFWNHEAMQAGSVYALDDEDWIFPSYRESAIGLLRGMPAATVLSWWRGHPAGWWNPADYNVASICVPIGTHVPHAAGSPGASGCAARSLRDRLLRRRRDLRGLVPRGGQLRGGHARAARALLQQQRLGDLDAGRATDARRDARRQGRRLRDAGRAGRRDGRARRLRGDARGGRACPRRRGADLHRGRLLPRRAARDRRRSEGVTSTWSASSKSARASASAATRRTCGARGS